MSQHVSENTELNSRLVEAANSGQTREVEALLRAGADANWQRPDGGYTALHCAASEGFIPVMRALIQHGADTTLPDARGNSPLIFAASSKHTDAVRLLLQTTPDYPLDALNARGNNALSLCITPKYAPDTAIALLDAGASPHTEIRNQEGERSSLFAEATALGNKDALYLLNQYAKAQPKLGDFDRQTVLDADSHVLQHPKGWQAFPEIAATLAQQGTPLTKADLLTSYAEGRSYLGRAAECYQLPKVLDYLHTQGETVTADDLLQQDGTPNALLQTCIRSQSVGALMSEANWKGQGSAALQRVWQALPAEGREQVGNYFSLNARVSQGEQQVRGR